jgi:hypothetical protein
MHWLVLNLLDMKGKISRVISNIECIMSKAINKKWTKICLQSSAVVYIYKVKARGSWVQGHPGLPGKNLCQWQKRKILYNYKEMNKSESHGIIWHVSQVLKGQGEQNIVKV